MSGNPLGSKQPTSPTLKWCCKVKDCGFRNEVDKAQFVKQCKQGGKLFCMNCGVEQTYKDPEPTDHPDYLACIPITGWATRLIQGQGPDGKYIDYNGDPIPDEEEYARVNGIIPSINYRWIFLWNKRLRLEEKCTESEMYLPGESGH